MTQTRLTSSNTCAVSLVKYAGSKATALAANRRRLRVGSFSDSTRAPAQQQRDTASQSARGTSGFDSV